MEDLPLLVEHFAKLASNELNKPIRTAPTETMEVLKAYDWPGNVRELQSAIKYAFVQATGEVLAPHWLPDNVQHGTSSTSGHRPPDSPSNTLDVASIADGLIQSGSHDIYRQIHADVDRILLRRILGHFGDNQVLASQALGISRTTLRSKLALLDDPTDEHGSGSAQATC
jgi:DNA-binding NtrC family response regulator